MNFKIWLEQKWREFKDTVILYHGTSSAYIPIIQTEGLKPPQENLEEYALKILKQYTEPTPELIEFVKKHIISTRTDTPIHKISSVIYLVPEFQQAANYAKSYYQQGGEIAFEIWRLINARERKRKNLMDSEPISPIFKHAHPIVVEVTVPFKWMKTYHNLSERHKSALDGWEAYAKSSGDYTDVNDFIDREISGFEVRVEETIPYSFVKAIHDIHQ